MLIYNENHTHWCTGADEAAGKWQSGGWMTRGRAEIADSKENCKGGGNCFCHQKEMELLCLHGISILYLPSQHRQRLLCSG